MTRFFLASVFALATASAAFAILPPLPPGVIFPPAPVAKDAPKPAEEEGDDVAKIADRIGKNAKGVSDKLGDRDTGDATRRDQAKLKQDLDKLIDLLQNQPPPPMSNDSSQPPPPMGGESGGKPPPTGGGPDQGKQPMGNGGKSNPPMGNKPGQSQRTGSGRREPKPMGGQPMPMPGGSTEPMGAKPMPMGGMPMPANSDPMGKPGGNQPGAGGKAAPALPIAETIAKDFWGHLPELPRQQMMQFFREQYNSRYKDLLPDYFTTLAEKEKKGKK